MFKSRLFKSTLMIAGTTIGAGMLAMPVSTSPAGFVPSLVIYLVCWLFMTLTGLLILEACLWMEGDTNMISMAEKTLGLPGKAAAWILYLFLFYSLTLAYVVGGGSILSSAAPFLSDWSGSLIFTLLFAPVVWAGAGLVGRLNMWLMGGLLASYGAFVFLGAPYVDSALLKAKNWSLAVYALPVVFTAFGFQHLVPTITRYLERDAAKIRLAILFGSALPLLMYLLWQWLIMGIIPTFGPGGLAEAENAVDPLAEAVKSPAIAFVGRSFALFALVTSFLGVSLGLRDFLSDGLGIEKSAWGRLLICSLIFFPVLLLAALYPGLFLTSLDLAGGIGCALLLGALPILMVWSGRYLLKLKTRPLFPGGRFVLALLLAFVLFEVSFELLKIFGRLLGPSGS